MNFLVAERTDLIGGHLRHRNSPTIKGSKFNLVAVAVFIDVNDRPDITNRKPVIGKASGQRHAVQLFDHAGRGYAVINDEGIITSGRRWQSGLCPKQSPSGAASSSAPVRASARG